MQMYKQEGRNRENYVSFFLVVCFAQLLASHKKEGPAMGTTHFTTRVSILGIALAIFTIPFLFIFVSGPQVQKNDPPAPLEFTDTRIVTFDLSVPYPDTDIVQRVTIDSDSPFLWCKRDSSTALPCPRSLRDEDPAQLWEHIKTHKGIPSL